MVMVEPGEKPALMVTRNFTTDVAPVLIAPPRVEVAPVPTRMTTYGPVLTCGQAKVALAVTPQVLATSALPAASAASV